MKAGKIVNESILGEDFKTVLINGKAYTIYPPTIHRIAGAAKCLSDIGEEVKTTLDLQLRITDKIERINL